ncbi:MAG: sulfatase-like hydrolase/transferase, partial [Planctomycetota bacterium]
MTTLVIAHAVWFTAPLAARPNIVVIVADDMGYSDLGCYGSEIRTPRLDALAAGGTRFTQFYNTAKCWTTRASLLTGLYYQQATDAKRLNGAGVTIAEVLRGAGYHTLMSGKWHLSGSPHDPASHPLHHGFDRFYGTIHGAGSFYRP